MPQIGPTELVLILVIVLIIFGANRLADLGAGLGKGVREFRQSLREVNEPDAEPAPKMNESASAGMPAPKAEHPVDEPDQPTPTE